jgi:DNA (cytosine-5)-methyltransferase 1
VNPISQQIFDGVAVTQRATVADAIRDLPRPVPETKDGQGLGWAKYPKRAERKLSTYAEALRDYAPTGLGMKSVLDRLENGFVSGMFETEHSAEIAARYSNVPGGASDSISKSYRLEWGGSCPTLRAGTGSEKGAFQAVRPLHPSEGRVITVREAARLQAFPDWFSFHPTKWHSFRMIGNSVSPSVSYGILRPIVERLSQVRVRNNSAKRLAA